MYQDTIAAIATPAGQGGIGIVRLSGPDSWNVVKKLFTGELRDHYAVHGLIRDPLTQETIDETLVTAMSRPKTYTREDSVEIGCHGSPLVLQRVLGLTLRHGARLANPGEFTLRAFLNGRLDLAQAEAVLDVIQAQTEASLRLAVQGLGGRLSGPIHAIREKVLEAQAYLTACIDFPDDEVEEQTLIDPGPVLADAEQELRKVLQYADAGIVYKHGIRTAIIGKPNVGKSSLLNRLLGEERAIVTPVAGTTRDTVEETATVAGIPFHLIDTAGIRESRDVVEQIGIERSRKAVGQADLILLVIDASNPLDEADQVLLAQVRAKPSLVIANKSDLPQIAELSKLTQPALKLSALTGDGIETLHEAMAAIALAGAVIPNDAVLVTNPRQKAALEGALEHLEAARGSIADQMPGDFTTIDLTACLSALGEVTGEGVTEELLDKIFQQFCIGK